MKLNKKDKILGFTQIVLSIIIMTVILIFFLILLNTPGGFTETGLIFLLLVLFVVLLVIYIKQNMDFISLDKKTEKIDITIDVLLFILLIYGLFFNYFYLLWKLINNKKIIFGINDGIILLLFIISIVALVINIKILINKEIKVLMKK